MTTPTSAIDIAAAMDIARAAAEAGSNVLREMASRSVGVSAKDDGSLVTEADLASERAILRTLQEAPFDAGVLTEEQGQISTHERTRWIVDPLDGTHRFTRKHRFWGPLIALEHDGVVIAASMAMPMVDEVYWAGAGLGAYCNGESLHVSDVAKWSDAVFAMGSGPRMLECPCAPGLLELCRTCEYLCAGGDLSGAALVFTGRAEAWIETGVKRWDLAPMGLFITEAGGMATDLTGSPLVVSGESMLISNGLVHEHVLSALKNVR